MSNIIIIGSDTSLIKNLVTEIKEIEPNVKILDFDIENMVSDDEQGISTILYTDSKNIIDIEPEEFIDFCDEFNLCPMFVAENTESIERKMLYTLESYFKKSLCYIKNDEKEAYEIFKTEILSVLND